MTFAEFILSIGGGFISGLFSSYVFQKRNRKQETLKLVISDGIFHGNDGTNEPFDYQRKFSFTMTGFDKERIDQLNEPNILALYESKKLELEHFEHKGTILEIVVSAIDSVGGYRQNVIVANLCYNEFTNKVINGYFNRDSLEIIPYGEDGTEEINGNNN